MKSIRKHLLAWLLPLMSVTPSFAQGTPQDFIRQSFVGLQDQQAMNDRLWKMSSAGSWNLDVRKGEIEFKFEDGRTVRAPMQIVGGYNAAAGKFLWGWDYPGIADELKKDARLVKSWAESAGLDKWTTRIVDCSEQEAWEFTAVAARLSKATGAYRVPTPGPILFVTFGTIRIEQDR
jgi:hypothetical protein